MTRKAMAMLIAGAGTLWPAAAPLVWAHVHTIQTVVEMAPGRPQVGQPSRVTVSVLRVLGDEPSAYRPERLWLVADMPAHAMRPVEVELTPTGPIGEYSGDLTFTMSGPWRVTLNLQDLAETMWATFDLEIPRMDQPAEQASSTRSLEMLDPVSTNLLPPGWVLSGAFGLVLLAEGTAFALRVRGIRRQRSAASSPASEEPAGVQQDAQPALVNKPSARRPRRAKKASKASKSAPSRRKRKRADR